MGAPADKTVLKNGIRILTKKMPHTRSVSMGVWVNVGARDENLSESGLSHFIEHMIFKGTRRRSAFQIAKEFDAIGGHTNAFTTMENTCYHAKVMDTHTKTMVDILSDIFLNSVFDTEEINRERPVILQEIGMVEDSPDEYIHHLSGRNFWGNNSLGQSILGSPENISHFSSDTLKSFFSRFYLPDRIIIAVSGNVEHEQFVELVGPSFENIHAGTGFPQRHTPAGQSLVDLNYRDLEQVHVCLTTAGLPVTDHRRYAFSLLNTILGGNMSSRLFQEVREKRGLAYSVYSFISSHVDTGMFGIYFAVDPKQIYETTNVVINEIQKLKNDPIDPAELKDAVEYTKGSLLLASESTDNQMVRAAQNEMHFNQEIPLTLILEELESVTAKEIQNLARELLQDDHMVLTTLGPVNDGKKDFEKILSL